MISTCHRHPIFLTFPRRVPERYLRYLLNGGSPFRERNILLVENVMRARAPRRRNRRLHRQGGVPELAGNVQRATISLTLMGSDVGCRRADHSGPIGQTRPRRTMSINSRQMRLISRVCGSKGRRRCAHAKDRHTFRVRERQLPGRRVHRRSATS